MRPIYQALLPSILASTVLFGAPRPKEERKPESPPQGEWVLEKHEQSGLTVYSKPKRPTDRDQRTVRFSPSKWEVFRADSQKPIRLWPAAYFKCDAGLEVDFFPSGPQSMRKGIWKLDGDILLVCYDDVGGDRPTEFTAPKGSNRVLYTLRRQGK